MLGTSLIPKPCLLSHDTCVPWSLLKEIDSFGRNGTILPVSSCGNAFIFSKIQFPVWRLRTQSGAQAW